MGSDFEWLDYLPKQITCFLVPHTELYYVCGFWGYIVFQVLRLSGVDVWDSQYFLNCPVTLKGGIDQPFIEQHNSVNNYFRSDWDGIPLPTERQGQGGFSVGPYMNNVVHFPKAGFYRNTDFHYPKETLIGYADAYPKLDVLLNQFEQKRFHRAEGYADLKGDPNILLRSLYNPVCKKEIQPAYQYLKAEEFLINVLEQLDKTKQGEIIVSPTLEDKARYIEQLLHENYMEPLTLKELAMKAGTNTEYLRRAFKSRTGKTIIEYLTEVRINKVKEFLKDTRLTLESIAMETGFCDADRLGRVFRKLTGQTPMGFRGFRGNDEL